MNMPLHARHCVDKRTGSRCCLVPIEYLVSPRTMQRLVLYSQSASLSGLTTGDMVLSCPKIKYCFLKSV
jgi:hypothetical protein